MLLSILLASFLIFALLLVWVGLQTIGSPRSGDGHASAQPESTRGCGPFCSCFIAGSCPNFHRAQRIHKASDGLR